MDQRKVERAKASDKVSYRVGDITATAPLHNLSTHGCRIDGVLDSAARGDPIEIILLEGVSIKGVVAWQRGSEFGVRFNRPIGEATVRYLTLAPADIPVQARKLDTPPSAAR